MEIREITCKAMLFRNNSSHPLYYCVGREDLDYLAFDRHYSSGEWTHARVVRATGVEMDNGYSRWFAVCVADCFDPPIAIVNADNEQDAEEAFVDKLPWAHIEEPDLKDYNEDDLSYGPSGQPYDSSEVLVWEVKPYLIEFE